MLKTIPNNFNRKSLQFSLEKYLVALFLKETDRF